MRNLPNVVDSPRSDAVGLASPNSPHPRASGRAFELAVGRARLAITPENSAQIGIFATDDPWYAVHVQGRREERFVKAMHGAGVPVFYPTEIIRRRRRRWEPGQRDKFTFQNVTRPLWRGYCFIAADDAGIYAAKATNVIYGIYPPAVQSLLVTTLKRIKDHMDSHPTAVREKYITPGTQCRVTHGAFKDFEGQWVAEKGGRGHLTTTLFGQPNTPLHIDVEFLEPL